MNISVKNHIQGANKTIYYFFLNILLSWAAAPAIVIFLPNFLIPQTVYTIIVTLIMTFLLYTAMFDFGQRDQLPYNWARYPLKGFVCGLIGFLPCSIAEAFVIFLANKYLVVPGEIVMETARGYVTQILYMPFLWIYVLIKKGPYVPEVTYSTFWIPAIYFSIVCGIGYLMGYKGKKLFKETSVKDLRKFFVYRKEK
jgi:hypothetical protein